MKQTRSYLFFLLWLLQLLRLGRTFSSGSVSIACSSRTPFHFPFRPQRSTAPFFVTTSDSGRGSVFVTLTGNAEFKGFMIQAHSNGQHVGRFLSAPENGQLLDCGHPGGAVSHRGSKGKKAITVEWSPLGHSGTVTFKATVVKQYSTFWNNLATNYTLS